MLIRSSLTSRLKIVDFGILEPMDAWLRATAGLFLAGCATSPAVEEPAVECRRASGKITIDGKADEAAWAAAPIIEFRVAWEGTPPKTPARARLLWDDRALYFFGEMEDGDLFADNKEHDGRLWHNDVVELFFKPNELRRGYYEFQVNAANTILDMYLPSRDSGGYDVWVKMGTYHVQAKVVLRGTLNQRGDRDQGWSVEGRIPWRDFLPTGGRPSAGDVWGFALCRYDYDATWEVPDLSSTAPLTERNFHGYEDYGRLWFVGR